MENDKDDKVNKSTPNEEILNLALERFKQSNDAMSENTIESIADLRFLDGEQWTVEDEISRKGRPTLTINRLPNFVDQVIGGMRQNKISIKVMPVDDDADPITAKVFDGIIRNIEMVSKARLAYTCAAESAVSGGFGYFRIITEFADDDSFDKEILIKRIINPFTVSVDPASIEPDGSDAGWGFVSENVSRKKFEEDYPNATIAGFSEGETLGTTSGWFGKDQVRIADYYTKESDKSKDYELWLLEQDNAIVAMGEDGIEGTLDFNGIVVKSNDVDPDTQRYIDSGEVKVTRKRKVDGMKVMHYKLSGSEILESAEFPSSYIPIIPVLGKEINIEGERKYRGVIRFAKDSQKIYNYMKSTITEVLALQPKTPFIADDRALEGYESFWNSANQENIPYLPYKGVDDSDRVIPRPERPNYNQPSVALFQEAAGAIEDMKGTTGIFDASLGSRSNETSGVAIAERKQESDITNFAYIDNLQISVEQAGRILLDMIPRIYDTERTIRILGEDERPDVVHLMQNNILKGMGEDGDDADQMIDLQLGKYDVATTTGTSYATKRKESVNNMLEFTKLAPQLAPMMLPLIAENSDWAGADKVVGKLKQLENMPTDGQTSGNQR